MVARHRRRPRHRPTSTSAAARYLRTGEVLPDAVLDELRRLRRHPARRGRHARRAARRPRAGPAAAPALRARPVRQPPPVPDADGLDFVVIRENTEGTYAGEGGFLRKGTPHEVATQGSVNTRMGVERCVRYAFDLARSRPRKHLTLVHKTNVLTFAGDLWQRTFDAVAAEFPDVDHRLQPRRRGLHLLRAGPRPLRRDRHRQPVRRHPHRPRRRRHRRHRAGRVGQPQPGPHRARRCSSRCTARRPTSSAPARPTPPRPSCRRGADARLPRRGATPRAPHPHRPVRRTRPRASTQADRRPARRAGVAAESPHRKGV